MKHVFFYVGGWKFLLSMAWRQGRLKNGDVSIFSSIETLVLFFFCLVCMCYGWTHDDGVARELLGEVHSVEISWSNDRRICCKKINM